MGRKIEEAMLHVATSWARSVGLQEVYASYCQTAKNKPCYDFFQKSGLTSQSGNRFVWDASQAYPLHASICLICDDGDTDEKTSADMSPPQLITDAGRLREAKSMPI